jgi:hypothetical protein
MTGNNKNLSLHPHFKMRIGLWLPDVRNPGDLYEIHQRCAEKFSASAKRYALNGNPAEYINQRTNAEVAHWVKEGYYKLDSAAQVYRLTWKGAVLIGFKYLWPIRPIQQAWQRYQTKKLLRKLEE